MARISRDDLLSGGIFVALGGYFALESLNYELGTPFRMGPGFLPLVLGGILAALGAAVAAKSLLHPREEEGERDPPAWRALGLIVLAVGLFGITIRGLGFVPTVFAVAALSAFASRETSPIGGVIVAAGLTVLSTVVFVFGLGLQVPLVGPWLRF